MKKAITILALAASVCLLTGCDFFRILAGRPTSREIEVKRMTIPLDREGSLQPADTLPHEQVTDLLQQEHAQETPKETPKETTQTAPVTTPKTPAVPREPQINTRPADSFEQRPDFRYYVMIGSFGSWENAIRQSGKAEAAGYRTTLLPFRSGTTAVGVGGSNDLDAVRATLERLRSESFCPKDAWILNIE